MDIRKICDSVETDVSGRYEEIKGKVMPSDFVQMYMSYFGWPEYVKVSETISERSGVTNEEVDEWITEHPEIIVEEYEKSVLPKDYEGFTEYVERMWTKYRAPKDSTPLKDSSNKGFERMKELLSPDGVIFAWKSYSSPGEWSDFLTYLRNNQEELRGKSGAELEDYIQYNASDFIPEFESYLSPEEIEDFTQYLARTYELEDEIEDAAPEERMSERIKSGVYEKLPLGWAFSEATEADARNYTLFVDVVKAADKSSLAQKIAEFLGAERTAKLAGFLNKELGLGVKSRINK